MMEAFFRAYIFLDKRKTLLIITAFISTGAFAIYVYMKCYGIEWYQAGSHMLSIFTTDVKIPPTKLPIKEAEQQLYIIAIIAKVSVILTIILIYIREILSWLYRWLVKFRGGHTIVVGLGRNSRFFINSMLEKKEYQHKIMAFEIDEENPYLDKYKNKRVSIVLKDVEKMLDVLNLEQSQNVFISTGSDEQNIYYALKFLERLNGTQQKLLVHIEDRTLRNFYSDRGVLHNCGVDLKVFSFNKEAARMLFQQHPLDGDGCKEIKLHIIGEDDLSISMLVEACKIAHFPNENRVIINCIAKETTALETKVNYAFQQINEIENISINYINKDPDTKEFYSETNELWKEIESLQHVFYCYDDIMKNIKIATKVRDITFLRRETENQSIKFHIATMNHKKIANEIESSTKENIFVFAQAEKICSYDNLINNQIDEIAKLINYDHFQASSGAGYTKEQIEKIENADDLWNETLINDKKSSMGQAIHIKTKLKYLGLEVRENHKGHSEEALLEYNKAKIYKALEIKNVSHFEFSPEMAKKLDKLALSEHNRWMALLKIMDYKCSKDGTKDKLQKYHPLLKPLAEFSEEEMDKYVPYDVKSILEIARYEAKVNNAISFKAKKEK